MASMLKFLSIFLFLDLVFKADADACSFKNIKIDQSGTGNWAHGMPEWKVRITNNCPTCPQSQVKLKCDEFQTNKFPDPSILKVVGSVCLVKNGEKLSPSETVEFLYAWEPKFSFQPISSQKECS